MQHRHLIFTLLTFLSTLTPPTLSLPLTSDPSSLDLTANPLNTTDTNPNTNLTTDPAPQVHVETSKVDLQDRNVPLELFTRFLNAIIAEAENGVALFGYASVIPSGVYSHESRTVAPGYKLMTQLRNTGSFVRAPHLTWGTVWDTYRVLFEQRERLVLARKPGFVPALLIDVAEIGAMGKKLATGSFGIKVEGDGVEGKEAGVGNDTVTFA